ncbi:type II toxin-antitoxin system VapC family toxin [Foetidibacter luteolus]|uniref:type II toxin-antitoxin system VapC family toxin n=1 Tax=Foetidibacter luteolus TaxID=2608880 RepID=UPI00129A90FE|nr:type II toxin-antitoxin system VapC family toxin [Foetidibacter luteolus]
MGQKLKILVDSDILIKTYRGNRLYKDALDSQAGNLAVSMITYYELMFGLKTKQRIIDLNKQMKAYTLIHISEPVSVKALELLKKYSVKHQLKLADALIASTALETGCKLFTDNIKDFEFIKDLLFHKF